MECCAKGKCAMDGEKNEKHGCTSLVRLVCTTYTAAVAVMVPERDASNVGA